jgi:hypothetical protein
MTTAVNRKAAPDVRRSLENEMAAAVALKHQLQKIFGEDADLDLLRDTIEGETDLVEILDRVLEQMARDAADVAGIDKFAATMEARKKRLQDRAGIMKTMLLNLLDVLSSSRLERPLALIFTRANPAKAVVKDEALIPSPFFKVPEPVLDKTDLL